MNSDDFYHNLKRQLDETMRGAQTINQEAMSHLRVAVSKLFDQLDLVTREEFDAQTAVLKRSREKIDSLEQQIQKLEQSLQSNA
ncbi:MAG: accessory factor UbiK family protein [Porticoccaceae bacterium]